MPLGSTIRISTTAEKAGAGWVVIRIVGDGPAGAVGHAFRAALKLSLTAGRDHGTAIIDEHRTPVAVK
jgi:hypothetical protein